jgi:hypothetical protein
MIIDIKDPPQLALSKKFQKKKLAYTFESGNSSRRFTDSASLLQNPTWGTQNSSLVPIRTSEYLKGLA